MMGGFFIALVVLILRFLTTKQKDVPFHIPPNDQEFQDSERHHEATLLIEPGGKLTYINHKARELFNIWDDDYNIERLSFLINPPDALYKLGIAEIMMPLSVLGKSYLATSYRVPWHTGSTMLITLRPAQSLPQNQDTAFSLNTTPQTIWDIKATSIPIDMPLEEAVKIVFEKILNQTTFDSGEIHLLRQARPETETYQLIYDSSLRPKISKVVQPLKPNSQTANIIQTGNVVHIHGSQPLKEAADILKNRYQSFLGVPIKHNNEVIGSLELYAFQENAFSEEDVSYIISITNLFGVELYNILRYREQQRYTKEISQLAQLTSALRVARDPTELFSRLNEGIRGMLDAEIIGFLIYDEANHELKAQNPFIGIPPEYISWYKVPISPDSAAERIWRSKEIINADDAPSDPVLQDLGISKHAVAAGIHNCVLIPITSGGRNFGYLQIGNKQDGTGFSDDDIRLLQIIANQAAPIIENAELIRLSMQRALRAEALRRIASLNNSVASLQEVMKYTIVEITRLLHASHALIYLTDNKQMVLKLNTDASIGTETNLPDRFSEIPMDSTAYHLTVTSKRSPIIIDDVLNNLELSPHYQDLFKSLNVQSAISVPIIVKNQGYGEIILTHQHSHHFTPADVQLLTTISSQLALAIEREAYTIQPDVVDTQYVEQLQQRIRIQHELMGIGDVSDLLTHAYRSFKDLLDIECGTFWIENTETGTMYTAGEDELTQIGKDILQGNAPYQLLTGDAANTYIHNGVQAALLMKVKIPLPWVGHIILHAKGKDFFTPEKINWAQEILAALNLALNKTLELRELQDKANLLQEELAISTLALNHINAIDTQGELSTFARQFTNALEMLVPLQSSIIGVYSPADDKMHILDAYGVPSQEHDFTTFNWSNFLNVLKPIDASGNNFTIDASKVINGLNWVAELLNLPETKNYCQVYGDIEHPDGFLLLTYKLNGTSEQDIHAKLQSLNPIIEKTVTALIKHNNLSKAFAELEQANLGLSAEVKKAQELIPQIIAQRDELHHNIRQNQTIIENLLKCLDISVKISSAESKDQLYQSLTDEFVSTLGFDASMVVLLSKPGYIIRYLNGVTLEEAQISSLLGQSHPISHSTDKQEILLCANVPEDVVWASSPLLDALQSKAFITIPFQSALNTTGCILASSVRTNSATDKNILPALDLIRNQIAQTLNTIENTETFNKRIEELNILMSFSRNIGSLNQDEIFSTLLNTTISTQQGIDVGYITAPANTSGQIVLAAEGYQDNDAMVGILFRDGSLPNVVWKKRELLNLTNVDFAKWFNLSADDLLKYKKATRGKLPLSGLGIPVQSADNIHAVMVLESFTETEPFHEETISIITALVAQAALMLENINLYRDAETRARQLETLTELSAQITSSLNPEEVIQSILANLSSIISYDTATLWIVEDSQLVIRSVSGFDNVEDLIGLRTDIEDSILFRDMIEQGSAILVPDIKSDPRFPHFDESQKRSWLGIPLIIKGNVIGALAIEKSEPNYYSQAHIQAAITYAAQASIALENANLYQNSLQRAVELDKQTKSLALINQFSNEISSTLDLDKILHITLQEITAATSATRSWATLYHQENGQSYLTLDRKYPDTDSAESIRLDEPPLFQRLRESFGIYQIEDFRYEADLNPVHDLLEQEETNSVMIIPLVTGNQVHGFIWLMSEHKRRYSNEEIEIARILINQAAVAVQNAQQYQETLQFSTELEKRVRERTQELEQEHKRTRILLEIMNRLSMSLDLDHVLHGTLELMNQAMGAEQSTILLIRPEQQTFYYRAAIGYTEAPPRGGRPSALKIDQGLAGWVIKHRQGVVIPDLLQDERWISLDENATEHRSAIAVPLMVGAEPLGAMLLFHRSPNAFMESQLELAQAAAAQMAVAINNAELFDLIRDQAEGLGTMLRQQQIEASRSMAILEAVADGVLVTDKDNSITLFNASAQKILGLDREKVVGNSLENFIGLFGGTGRAWMETIHRWSRAPEEHMVGETYFEQIELDNGRVVSVHLAPVFLQDEFLGTVSVFRDITHLIEVDRLKTEFVATVSHELRTPMTSIKGYVDIMLMGATGELTEQQRNFLNVVRSNTERLNILVNDLLDVSRIEAGKLDLSFQPIDLRKIFDEARQTIEKRKREDAKEFSVEIDTAENLPMVYGDKDRVLQIINNLVMNAYNYTPSGGKVLIRASTIAPDFVQIDIQDNGIGIPPEEHERVFERFYRGENPLVLATAGTGLGLSIVKQLVEMHKGKIWFESTGVPGEGTTFSFTLPVFTQENKKESK